MRTFIAQITKQFAIGQRQGRIAVATGSERAPSTAQHLGLELGRGLRRLSHLCQGVYCAAAADRRHAWQNAARALDWAADAGITWFTGVKPGYSKSYGISVVGLMPVAVCRLPMAHAAGMPMPRSVDC